jgi:hypothetical protein
VGSAKFDLRCCDGVLFGCLQGYDASAHVLTCFGGAGGQHACAIAKSLGMKTIFVHRWEKDRGRGVEARGQQYLPSVERLRVSAKEWLRGHYCRLLRIILRQRKRCQVLVFLTPYQPRFLGLPSIPVVLRPRVVGSLPPPLVGMRASCRQLASRGPMWCTRHR